jgi:hypothetical protein
MEGPEVRLVLLPKRDAALSLASRRIGQTAFDDAAGILGGSVSDMAAFLRVSRNSHH